MKVILAAIMALMSLTGCSKWGTVGLTTAGVAAVSYWILDPQAPNWNVEMSPINETEYLIDMKMKTFVSGGDGEARVIFRAAAEEMVRRERAAGYHIVSYAEGINTEFLGGRRYASGVIRLQRPGNDPEQMWLDRP